MPWKRFALFNFLGAATWVTVISGAGYLFGRHWVRLERDLKRFDIAIAALAVLAVVCWWWRNRNQNGKRHLRS
jgi:membrane-associated protein